MNVKDFEYIAQLLYQRSGLVITQEKAYLLESRLNPVARKWDLEGIDSLIATLRSKKDERLAVDVTEAMTTNESFFFRDNRPFDQFKEIVRSEEHTSELQSLMRISYAVFCLKKQKKKTTHTYQ